MALKIPAAVLDDDHIQVVDATAPSGSVSAAVSGDSVWGCVVDSVTVPASSMLSTEMVTVMLSLSPDGSVAVTVTV